MSDTPALLETLLQDYVRQLDNVAPFVRTREEGIYLLRPDRELADMSQHLQAMAAMRNQGRLTSYRLLHGTCQPLFIVIR
jgi:hypothetical protein